VLTEIDRLLETVKRIHFIGIGGAGMCPLAEILHQKGYQLSAIVINGKIVNIDGQDKKKGTFRVENIQTDQTIDVRFAPAIVTQTPKPTPTPEPETGEEAVVTSSSDKAEVAAGVAAGLSNQGPGGKGGEEADDKKTEDGKNGFNLPAFLQSVLERILENAVWSPVIGVTAAAMLIALIVLLVTGTRIRMARKAQHERFMKKRREDEAMLMRQLEEDRRFAGRLENMSFEELKDLR
jgi:hypothetical protein